MARKGPKPLQEGKRVSVIKVGLKDHTKAWLERLAMAAQRSVSWVSREILEAAEPDDEKKGKR